MPGFFQYLTEERGLNKLTVARYLRYLNRLADYLRRIEVTSLRDLSPGAELKRQSLATTVRTFAYSPDGKLLSSTQSGAAPRVWDAQSLTSRELEASGEDCSAITFSADGSTLVCGGSKGVIFFWDAASRSLVARILRASDGRWLVITPEGLFDGTPSGNGLATWRLDNRSFAIDQLPKSFRHEGLLQELLAGKRPKPKEELAAVLNASAHQGSPPRTGGFGSHVSSADSVLGDQPVRTLQQFRQFTVLLLKRLDP